METRLDKWNVFNFVYPVGTLIYDEIKKVFSFEPLPDADEGRLKHTYRRLNANEDSDVLKETLFDRIFPPNRVNARELLDEMGLAEYDPWEIIKLNHLQNCNDMIWMSKGTNPDEFWKIHMIATYIKIASANGVCGPFVNEYYELLAKEKRDRLERLDTLGNTSSFKDAGEETE